MLVGFGLMQARTRRVPSTLALLLPAAMMVLSLSGLLQSVGLSWPALLVWFVALCATTALGFRKMQASSISYDAKSQRVFIPGSWAPRCVMLGICVVRYAIGVASGLRLESVRTAAAHLAIGAVLGALSGFFAARGACYWHVIARTVRRPSPEVR